MYKLKTDRILHVPFPVDTLPDGWLSKLEIDIIYTVVRNIETGNFFEIGSWEGRSSCVIASAIAEKSSCEIFFSIIDYGICGYDDWLHRFNNSPFIQKDADRIAKVIYYNGGTLGKLKQNLVDRKLSHFVNQIVAGDLLDYETTKKFNFIFCDCTHNPAEIDRNVPYLKELLADDCVLICDDIHTIDSLAHVKSYLPPCTSYLSNTINQYSKFGIFTFGKYEFIFE